MIPVDVSSPGRGTFRAHSSFVVPFARDSGGMIAAGALDLVGPAGPVAEVVRALKSGATAWAEVEGKVIPLRLYAPSGARTRQVRIGEFLHVLLGTQVWWELLEEGAVLWGADGTDRLLSYVRTKTAVPVLREWLPRLPEVLRSSLREYQPVGSPPVPLRVLRLVEDPERELRAALRRGDLEIPGAPDSVSPRLVAADTLEGYLRAFAPELAARVREIAAPLRRPGDPDDPRLRDLVRRPFRAQAEVIQGLAERLRRSRDALLVGDMGTGKTFCAGAVSWLLHPSGRYRVLVMCPAHLVPKWCREIRMTVPGARVRELRSWRDALCLPSGPPEGPEFYVVSRETAKLGWFWRPGVVRRRGRWECPRCGAVVAVEENSFRECRAENARCRCGEVLWQADGSRPRRVAVADLVKRLPRGYFDLFVGDEAHEYKAPLSAQGRAFGILAARAKRTLALTGTLTGGYASNLFHLLFRMDPEGMRKAGYGYSDVAKFVAAYGCLEKVAPVPGRLPARTGRVRALSSPSVRERPGISPAVFSAHLLERCAFLELSDLENDLPLYREEVLLVDMVPEQREAYSRLRSGMEGDVRRALRFRSGRLSGYLHAALSFPDRPARNPAVTVGGRVVAEVPDLPEDVVWPKERALVDLCLSEAAQGRRVFVYLVYTDARDVSARLEQILREAGLRVAVLRESVRPAVREEWIARQVVSGVQVLVGNARLVQLGLDLLEFPTLAFYQTGYSLFTLRQASRRSWRIGQTQPVRVVFLAYRDHLQEAALRLMGTKLRAALALEGRFSSEGLRAMAEGDDLGVELARVLVEGLQGLEPVETLWGSPIPETAQVVPLPVRDGRGRQLGVQQLVWEFAAGR